MCDERQCKRQPNNDYCHCEDHYMQMSNADCAPRSNTGCTPYQLEALENMCKMSCKENPLEYLIRAEANERKKENAQDLDAPSPQNNKNKQHGSNNDTKLDDHTTPSFHAETGTDHVNSETVILSDDDLLKKAMEYHKDLTAEAWKKLNNKKTPNQAEKKAIVEKRFKAAPKWNDTHFKTNKSQGVNGTWIKLANLLRTDVGNPISEAEKKVVVVALMKWQSENGFSPDGQYGIKSAKKLESTNHYYACDTPELIEKRQQNIQGFLLKHDHSKKDTSYVSRHARYLAEFMSESDSFDQDRQNGEQVKNNEQIPYHLVKRMILDDLETKNRDNIGLLSLWLGTAQWGVSGVGSLKDPVDSDWKGPHTANGKRTREYEQGGIGIADYDDAPLARFYEVFGTPDQKPMDESRYVNKKASGKDGQKKTYKYSSKAYDTIKSDHEFYEYISPLFDRGDGTKQGDEWNDEASIWLMEDWIKDTWNDSKITQYHDVNTQIVASRIKNSGHVSLGKKDTVATLTKKYGDYGESRPDRTREDYLNRLKYTERLTTLHESIQKDFDKGERVSEDGMSIITKDDKPEATDPK